MDKVMIDGIDVSECEYANACDKKIKCVILQDDVCEIDPYCEGCNCYYKQLKRLEQENEQLKKSIDRIMQNKEIKTIDLDIAKENAELKAENERLKEENEELCDRMAEVTYRVTGGRLSYSNYTLDAIEQAFYDQLEILSDQKSEIYKQALQEIRDIILSPEIIDEETKKLHTSEELDNIVRWHREDKLSKIQAKINEVIGAE